MEEEIVSFFKGYLGLLVNAPTDIAQEASGSGYSRQGISFTATGDGRRVLAISSSYSFGYAVGNWGLVTGLALFIDNTTDAQPLIAWPVSPVTVTDGQTYTVSSDDLSLLVQMDGFFAPQVIIGVTASGANVITRQPVALIDGVLNPALSTSSGSSTNGTGNLSVSQLGQLLSQLMQTLPKSDPGDGTSLWCNANLLSISVKS